MISQFLAKKTPKHYWDINIYIFFFTQLILIVNLKDFISQVNVSWFRMFVLEKIKKTKILRKIFSVWRWREQNTMLLTTGCWEHSKHRTRAGAHTHTHTHTHTPHTHTHWRLSGQRSVVGSSSSGSSSGSGGVSSRGRALAPAGPSRGQRVSSGQLLGSGQQRRLAQFGRSGRLEGFGLTCSTWTSSSFSSCGPIRFRNACSPDWQQREKKWGFDVIMQTGSKQDFCFCCKKQWHTTYER